MRIQTQTKGWIKKGSLAGLVAAVLLWVIPGTGLAQEEEVVTGGKFEFQNHCAICHGLDGKGNGPMANLLEVKSADLTQLSKKNGGQFPFWRVFRVIDGREEIRGHGTREMPIWGIRFRIEGAKSEDQVRGRILLLVHYLQSIQEE